jgi:aspartyl-tRNA(Asn)/glutamyl-tRNA(Gln) amidotransferase subunit A
MYDEIYFLDAVELAQRIRNKALSPVEVAEAHLQRIAAVNSRINAVVTLADDVLENARAAEVAVAKGETLGPLHGVPFTCKDTLDVKGVRTTRGSRLFEHHIADRDATAVARLKRAGGIFLAKTNVPEFALWWETENCVFGRTNNPWNLERTAGGSSGGEAAAIAAGLSPVGIGSDVGGSIRMPAHYCGIVGIKATHGRVPLTGHWPEVLLRAMHVGPLARSVCDVALALRVMCGPDGVDPYAIPVAPVRVGGLRQRLPRLRIGWTAERVFGPVEPEVQQTLERAAALLSSLGCRVEPARLTTLAENDAQAISATIWALEAGYYLKPLVAGHEPELFPFMRRRLATPWPGVRDYLKALTGWEAIRHSVAAYFSQYDVLLCPTVPIPAYPHGLSELVIGGEKVMSRRKLAGLIPWNLTGSPALSVPFGTSSEGLPIGVQVIGRHFGERIVLKVASALEQGSGLRDRRPAL